MGSGKKYLSNQFKGRMFYLEHEEGSEFYLSSLQNNRSAVPLLLIRLVVFLGCVGILLSSIILTSMSINGKYWPIYFTHWGLTLITLCSFFACWVSFAAYTRGPIDCTFGLPWYVKAYWFSFNVAVPLAIFITAFYYTFLTGGDEEFAIDPVLDTFIHAVNSILMLCLLLTAQHPSHILHFYHPLCVGLLYMAFGLIYYHAGGTDPMGNPWIYPNIDWRDPGPTSAMVVASAVMILIVHLVIVLISLARDWFSRRFIRDTRTMSLNS
ncbi:protein rolling stone-like [Plodia interpunctella]|uniref:protein rolling stone-like n=1 Tax=Plodia interpunctella TaxID=58824 RepID=UPI002367B195|nr:protein rolling stone-like [Plodia interpunctella]